MKIAISSDSLKSPCSSNFGRARHFLFVESESMRAERLDNPAMGVGRGAGIEAARTIVEQGAQALITRRIGPKARDVLAAAEVDVYLSDDRSGAELIEALRAGALKKAPLDLEPMGSRTRKTVRRKHV